MDDEGEGRICEGESEPWEQETCKQWGTDAKRPWMCRFSSGGSHFLFEIGKQIVSDSEKREGHVGGLEVKQKV